MSPSDLWQNFSLGVARSAVLFPFEHPLELVKVMAQATPEQTTWKIAHKVIKEKGLMGFSDTVLTNFPRRLLRESVRWPVIGLTHDVLVSHFPIYFKREGTPSKVFTGFSVALFDSLFILPLEQLIAYRVKEQEPYQMFFKSRFTKEGLASLYRGLSINLIRQGIMWTTVMALNSECKKRFDLINKDKTHPYLRQGITSIVIASALTAWVLPIDFIKTKIQMEVSLQNKTLLQAIRSLSLQHPYAHFYAGALAVFTHTLFHATFAGYLMDKIFAKRN